MYELAVIKEEIESLRSRLDAAIKNSANREDILAISRTLDDLIYKYYNRESLNIANKHIYKSK